MSTSSIKVTYCLLTLNRLAELQKAIRHTALYVDRTIVIDGCSTDGSQEWLASDECRKLGVEYKFIPQHLYQYGNHNPDKRNPYIEIAGSNGWILVMDTDEYLETAALQSLRPMAILAEEEGYDGIKFLPHDIWQMEDGTIHNKRYTDWWAPMFWKSYPGQHYEGHTHVRIVRPGAKDNWLKTNYHYKHIKDEKRLWRNSTQNYWTTVGLATNNIDDQTWLGFHELMKKYNYLDWHLFDKVMTAGTVPKEILEWFKVHKDATNPEERAWYEWYVKILHPELI
jgi:glycosyltransferase involved in cell wall biosynthesis